MTRIAVLDDRGALVDDFRDIFGIELPDAEFMSYERVNDALDEISNGGEWDIWIVDLMIARGRLTADETDDGLSTGLRVIERLIKTNKVKCKIIAYTLRDVSHGDHFNNNTDILICPKKDYTVTDVVKIVKKLLVEDVR